MHKKLEMNSTKIKGGCQSGRTVVTHNCKSDLPLGKIQFSRLAINGIEIFGRRPGQPEVSIKALNFSSK